MRTAAAEAVEALAREWSNYGFGAGRPVIDELRRRLDGRGGALTGSVVVSDQYGNSAVVKGPQKIVAASRRRSIVVKGDRWIVDSRTDANAPISFVAHIDDRPGSPSVPYGTTPEIDEEPAAQPRIMVHRSTGIPIEPSWIMGSACGLLALIALPHDALPAWLRLVLIVAASLIGSFGTMAVRSSLRRRARIREVLAARAELQSALDKVSTEWVGRELDPGWAPPAEPLNAFVLAHAEAAGLVEALGPEGHRLCDGDVADARAALEKAQECWREVSRD